MQDAVAQLQGSELERARSVAPQVWRARDRPQTRAKHMRFCWRGFSGDVVRRAVQGAEASDEE
nr:hypothetical protein [Acidovorax sp. 1608163]